MSEGVLGQKKRAGQVQQDFGSALEKGDLVQLPKLLGDAEQLLGECDTLETMYG